MAYVKNILPKDAAYYTLNRATIEGSDLILEAGGYAEISVSRQILPKLTSKMLVVIHPSIFSDYYTNNAVQVDLSVILPDGTYLDYLVSASQTSSGVFNAELEFPEGDFINFIYRISSAVPVTVYNWELCYQEATDLTTVIEGVEQEIPKLLYDYNTYAYAVGQKELTVGLITCYLLDNTSLQGHFTLSFFATERCNVHVRIKDNGITELFSPQVYTVEKGYASISIPHAYLNKLATDHTFAVTIQCTNGQLSIPVRGLLYTIDGGYLATRLLDAGIDVQDISIKQIPTDPEPSEIWAIGYEGNRMLLKKCAYDIIQRDNWQAVKDFGEAKAASVEFRGDWIGRGREWKYTIETDSTPYVFIVDMNNNLLVYSGDAFENVCTLETNVSSVQACQGFNSMNYPDQDQGLVIVYVKEGNVYYRQLVRTSSAWLTAEPLYEDGNALFASVHRLPDYRIGICVEHAGGVRWYITDRTYVNQAVKPEMLHATAAHTAIATVYKVNEAPDIMQIKGTPGSLEDATYHDYFTITYEYPLKITGGMSKYDLIKAISVRVDGTIITVRELEINNNTIIVYLMEPQRGGTKLEVNYNFLGLAAVKEDGCYVAIVQAYTFNLSMPTFTSRIPENSNIAITSQLNALVTPVITRRLADPNESLTSSVSGNVHALVTPIITNRFTIANESSTLGVTGTVSAAVIQNGISPI